MDVEYFFHRIGLEFSPKELNAMQEEFLAYQLLSETDIPKDIWNDALVVEKEGEEEVRRFYRMDVFMGVFV